MQKKINRKNRSKGRTAPGRGLATKLAKIIDAEPKNDLPAFNSGDVVRVHAKIMEGTKERIQIFEGTVIAQNRTAEGGNFTVRKMSHGVGVERKFHKNSRKVSKVEIMTPGRVRRSKLFYLRELEGRAAKVDRDVEAQESATPTT